MPDQMQLVITIRKPVSDAIEARTLYEIVKERLENYPSLFITGHCANHFDLDQE